ncbi:hypothetical protein DQ384_25755 [Sphaerisporangium album]|uniref:Uncharacterized protein n=2 Tax=Sphaerisporangium album TaxID=509200 RepID=A0A367FE09_9ACTN|nr:hypothetical protein DQ384_25755 [Sphaerisporangium album]
MLAVVCVSVLTGAWDLIIGADGVPFATQSALVLFTLISPVNVALAVGAVVLATRFGEPLGRARLVNLIAAAALALATLLGLVALVGVLVGGAGLLHNLLSGLPVLALAAVGTVYLFSVLPPAAPSAARPAQEAFGARPGEYGPQPGFAGQPGTGGFVPPQGPGGEHFVPPHGPQGDGAYGPQGDGAFGPHGDKGAYGPGGQPSYGPPPQNANGFSGAPGNAPASAPSAPSASMSAPAPASALPALPPGPHAPQQGYGPDGRPAESQPRHGSPEPYQPQYAAQGEQYPAPAGEQRYPAEQPYAGSGYPVPGDQQFAPRPEQQFAQQAAPSFAQQSDPSFAQQSDPSFAQQSDPSFAPQAEQPFAPQAEPRFGGQPQPSYAAAGEPGGDPYGLQHSQPLETYTPTVRQENSYSPQADAQQPPSTGAFGRPSASVYAPQPSAPSHASGSYAPQAPSPYAAQGGGEFGNADAFTTGARQALPSEPLTAPTPADQAPQQSGAFGRTGPQVSPLDPSYGQTGPQTSPLDKTYGLPPQDQGSSYGQTGQRDQGAGYGQPSPLDPGYGQTAPQVSPLDAPSPYAPTGPQTSPLDAAPSYGGYSSDYGLPEPSPLYAEGTDPRQQQLAQAYQQAQSYQQSQSGTPESGEYPGTGTHPVRTPDYNSYGASPFGHPQMPADTTAYSRPAAESQPYPAPQDQAYQPGRSTWEDPPAERTVRFDPKAAYQKDPLNAPLPPGMDQGRADEAIAPTAIYAPDRSARPEESPGRDQTGSGVDQGAPWYGSDR